MCFAYSRLSTIFCARGPKARLTHSFTSSRNSESEFAFGLKVSLRHLCFVVACDCGPTCFRRNKFSAPSSVGLLLTFMFLNVCSAFFKYVKAND